MSEGLPVFGIIPGSGIYGCSDQREKIHMQVQQDLIYESHSQVVKCFELVVRSKHQTKASVFNDLVIRLSNRLSFSGFADSTFNVY